MKTFLTVKFTLVPFLVFYALLARGATGAAIGAGLALIVMLEAWRLWRREFFVFELGSLAIFLTLGAAWLFAPATVAANALWLSFAGQGIVALASVAIRRPWTADYSRAAYPDSAHAPQFFLINAALSALWGALFLALALARFLAAPGLVATLIVATGAALSIFGPKLAIRIALKKLRASRETYSWPAPAFDRIPDQTADCDVAIVGAGVGGLTAAAFLADAGHRVAVFDQHVLPGGYCHHYPRKAHYRGKPVLYRFDAGPHDFSGVWNGGAIHGLLTRLGVADRIDWKRVDHSYVTKDGRIDPPRDWRQYARDLGAKFPDSAAGVMALFEEIHAIFEDMYATSAGRSGIPGMPENIDDMLAFPKKHPAAFKWMGRPFDELVASHVSDPRVKSLVNSLSGYLGDGTDQLTCADMVPIFGYYFKGGFYPVGGSGRFSEVLVEAIEERGGAVHLKSPVKKIIVENDTACGVELRDGRTIRAKAVVSNADLRRTFLELVDPQHTPADFRTRLETAPPACSAFTVQLGVDYSPDIKPATHVEDGARVGIAAMSLVDPSAAPAGHAILNLIRLVPYEEAQSWFPSDGGDDYKAWRRSDEYRKRKLAIGDEMIAAAEAVLPGLRDHIVYRTDASPVTYARYDWASAGTIYGPSAKGRLKGAKSPVRNLVVAGGATMGAGVEAVVVAGAEAAEALSPGVLGRSPGAFAGQARKTRAAA
ncbi:MAG: FAD-dependent oxidoreductase [Hyphomicrobiales bacterium]|nr:FAD-dependent oxidoreductase [Hyphomicrobiales bacterium]